MATKILLVDDSKILRAVLKRIVETAGYEVAGTAEDGIIGLEMFLSTKPDITLMDVTMPNMSGKECLEEILKKKPDAKIVMISGLADPQIEKDCLQIGAKAFISKSDITDMNSLGKKIIETLNAL